MTPIEAIPRQRYACGTTGVFFRRDQMNAVSWLRKAARNGSAMAQYNLAVLIRDGAEQGGIAEARFWFHQASLGGVWEAREELKKLEKPPLLDAGGCQ